MPIKVLGSHMGPHLQSQVKQAFVHRFTGDNIPTWAKEPMSDGTPYPLQFASDAEWLANTYFSVNKDGALSRRPGHCESKPTWPNNPELRG